MKKGRWRGTRDRFTVPFIWRGTKVDDDYVAIGVPIEKNGEFQRFSKVEGQSGFGEA
jgi:hypothetical protein